MQNAMKVSKVKNRKVVLEDSTLVLLAVPDDLHRMVKSEAALRKVKVGDIIMEALKHWADGRR